MFKEYIIKFMAAEYENRIMIFDYDGFENRFSYSEVLSELGFTVLHYEDVLKFRYLYERKIKNSNKKFAVVVEKEIYIPYDVLSAFYRVDLGWYYLFPKLNKKVLCESKSIDLDLLYSAYLKLYTSLPVSEDTNAYIVNNVYGKENVETFIQKSNKELLDMVSEDSIKYNMWFQIAAKKAKIEYLAARSGVNLDLSFVDEKFKAFILDGYNTISSLIHKASPVMVSRVMDFIYKKNEKIALIVLDGMSVFDFNIISEELNDIDYQENFIYTLIPTTTAISRQSLLSGKFPVELEKPFDLSREEKEFFDKAKDIGYTENQILYVRGYEQAIGPNIKCLVVVLNEIDDLVHNQTQGRIGMYYDVGYFAKTRKLQKLIKDLSNMGFNVYLTSDHGNTICKGIGTPNRTSIEIQSKAKRMLIFKDFADNKDFIDKYKMIDYPGYYLDKHYKYYICDTGNSFNIKGSTIMTHGGISIDEVIVPFIKVKEVRNGKKSWNE